VACVQALIEKEMAAGHYEPPADPATLAYALVHLRHAFLWNDATSGVRGDYERLREVQAALLGIPRKTPPAARRARHA
jgi:Tetracyclin repressor-like, C-terminal domain